MSELMFVKEIITGIVGVQYDTHISSVESHLTAAGIPDLDFCISGLEGHIEVKFSSNKLAPKIRSTQVRWFKKRVRAGGTPWVFAKLMVNSNWHYCLFNGAVIDNLAKTTKSANWVYFADKTWTGIMTKPNWSELVQTLRREI